MGLEGVLQRLSAAHRLEDLLRALGGEAVGLVPDVDLGRRLLAADLLGFGVLGDALDLEDVVAELALDDVADLALAEGEHGVFRRA